MMSLLLMLHIVCALVSITLFIWRGARMWINRPLSSRLFRRSLPDTVDTLFLVSGISMAFVLGVSPLESGWLAAKIIALLIYIGLGEMALRFGSTNWLKRVCFIAAILVFGYIVGVAKTMEVVPWM